jgi:hypothetical protein
MLLSEPLWAYEFYGLDNGPYYRVVKKERAQRLANGLHDYDYDSPEYAAWDREIQQPHSEALKARRRLYYHRRLHKEE